MNKYIATFYTDTDIIMRFEFELGLYGNEDALKKHCEKLAGKLGMQFLYVQEATEE